MVSYIRGDDNFDSAIAGSTAVSKTQSGYITLSSGLIIQWARGSVNSSNTFPIAFPNACFAVAIAAVTGSTSSSYGWSIGSPSTTSVSTYSNGAIYTSNIHYIAIGH